MKTAEVLVQMLLDAGVSRVYGLSGDSLNAFTDSLRTNERIEWVHVRHGEVAAFAAGAEAHLTDQLAVCAGSCGPGNLHLINGLFDCYRSRVPVLAIAAQIPSIELGNNYFQETHPEILYKELLHGRRMEWKHIITDLCRPNFSVAEIGLCSRRKLHREMVRIAFGQATDRRRADKDQPR